MNLSSEILKSEYIGIRELRENLSKKLQTQKTLIITEHGEPVNVILPYTDLIELLDIIDEISDNGSVKAITNGRQSIKAGNKGVSFNNLANRIKKQYEL